MAKSSENKNIEPIATTLGKETVFSGTMRFTSSLKIDGNFKGEIVSAGFLYVEEGAQIQANIKVGSVVVGGVVHGNIIATEKLEMLSTGRVYGNVTTSKLKIADGVVFEGKCEMIKDPDDVDIFSSSVAKIKDSLQTV
ncbi:MAG: cell division protein [Spirochaetales bacterium]|jgi:cytoskeletal protein CcmA (bactofilin family)|nr:cell division protein [Spirochaetales bacterium]